LTDALPRSGAQFQGYKVARVHWGETEVEDEVADEVADEAVDGLADEAVDEVVDAVVVDGVCPDGAQKVSRHVTEEEHDVLARRGRSNMLVSQPDLFQVLAHGPLFSSASLSEPLARRLHLPS
jgi:hypothetical protein